MLGNTDVQVLGEKVLNYNLEAKEIYYRSIGKVKSYAIIRILLPLFPPFLAYT